MAEEQQPPPFVPQMMINTVKPRQMVNGESAEQYLRYIECVSIANDWNDIRTAAVFKAMIPFDSELLAIINYMTAQETIFRGN